MRRGSIFENVGMLKEMVRELEQANGELDVEIKGLQDENPLRILDGVRVVGVDGSEFSPLRELGIPVGAVQASRIKVTHGSGEYHVEIFSDFVHIEENLNLKRFAMEIELLMESMDGESYLFYDGSLLLSFVSELNTKIAREYMKLMTKLIKESENTSTPLIGYIDRSYAKDLARRCGIPNSFDAGLLKDIMPVMSYTQPVRCDKNLGYEDAISFSYLKIVGLPSRIEFPAWMEDDIQECVRIVLAESRIGSTGNYPYILERAHKYAAITAKEKDTMMRVVKSSGVSFKWISKVIP
jgi:hypothetical protein